MWLASSSRALTLASDTAPSRVPLPRPLRERLQSAAKPHSTAPLARLALRLALRRARLGIVRQLNATFARATTVDDTAVDDKGKVTAKDLCRGLLSEAPLLDKSFEKLGKVPKKGKKKQSYVADE